MILNRPFRSVGELGFVYRDEPFKTLDFWSSKSADAALLDLFSVNDQPAVVAGQVDINQAPPPVLTAILSGIARATPWRANEHGRYRTLVGTASLSRPVF